MSKALGADFSFNADLGRVTFHQVQIAMQTIGRNQTSGRGRGGVGGYTLWHQKCAQYVTRVGQRVPCDRPCTGFYCEKHGGGWVLPQSHAIGQEP